MSDSDWTDTGGFSFHSRQYKHGREFDAGAARRNMKKAGASTRLANSLVRCGIESIKEADSLSDKELLANIYGFGKGQLAELRSVASGKPIKRRGPWVCTLDGLPPANEEVEIIQHATYYGDESGWGFEYIESDSFFWRLLRQPAAAPAPPSETPALDRSSKPESDR